jgi:hypothetical protein
MRPRAPSGVDRPSGTSATAVASDATADTQYVAPMPTWAMSNPAIAGTTTCALCSNAWYSANAVASWEGRTSDGIVAALVGPSTPLSAAFVAISTKIGHRAAPSPELTANPTLVRQSATWT